MQAISSLLAGSASTQTSQYIVPPAAIAPATYHSWAHKHWYVQRPFVILLLSLNYVKLNVE